MQLAALLPHVEHLGVRGPVDREVRSVTRDSREAVEGSIFVAVRGASVDGHDFVAGCAAPVVVVERPTAARSDATVVTVSDSKLALAQIAAALHGHPGRALPVVGITGTNGKTTTATIADGALSALGWTVGRIGTHSTSLGGVETPTRFTTPEAPALQALLAQMHQGGARAVVMEVSSIGLAQHRVDGVPFALGVFTNLSQDHLGFHGTMDAYRAAKARLFEGLLRPAGGAPRALLFGDDPAWSTLGAPEDRWTYGLGAHNTLRLDGVQLDADGVRATLHTPDGDFALHSPLLGMHNALNAVAAWGILRALGVPGAAAAEAVGRVQGVAGRLERVADPDGRLVVVDYAHSDDALSHVLKTLRLLTAGRLWVVFGCGGDRDRTKRPKMGRVAVALADEVVVTSDNPRSEDPAAIVAEIVAGVPAGAARVELDRGAAIRAAIDRAGPGDTVLIAGKGHETYQEARGVRVDFDDRAVARGALGAR